MSTLLKKIVFSFLSFLVLFTSVAPSFLITKAAPAAPAPSAAPSTTGAPWYNQSFGAWYGKVYDKNTSPESEIFGERYTAAQVQWVIYGLFAFILNSSTNSDVLSCVISNATNLNTCKDGIVKLIAYSGPSQNVAGGNQKSTNLLSLIFADRSLSGVTYIKDRISNFSLIPEAKAQTTGFGFNILEPIQSMWVTARNISFGLFVIAAIVFSFMIMFRVKISPQVVITIQSAIPKLIIALILVTFSYAIAGFLVDIMYVVIGLFSLIVAPMIPVFSVAGLSSPAYNPTDVFKLLTTGQLIFGTQSFNIAFPLGILGLIFFYLAPLMIILWIICMGSIGLALITDGFTLPVMLFFLFLLVVVVLVALWMSFKTIWKLFKAFANIVLLTILAPIQIVIGTLVPSFSFSQWLMSFVSNLSVFVVTGLLWTFAWIFMLQALKIVLSFNFSSPGGASIYWPPLIGGIGGGELGIALLYAGVSFVFFTLIPKATEVIQGLISGKPFAYGTAIGEALGPAMMAGGAAMDYRSTKERGRLEREVKEAEGLYPTATGGGATDARVTEARQRLSNFEATSGLINKILKGR